MAPEGLDARRAAMFAGLVVAWGFNYLFVRVGLALSPPLWLAFLRAGVGALGSLALLAATGSSGALSGRRRGYALLLGLPNTALFFGLWMEAGASVLPGEAATVIYTFPLWVALLSSALFGRALGGLHWAAVGGGFAGIVLISEPWTGGNSFDPVAIAELLGAALSWAFATVVLQAKFSPNEIQVANAYQLLGGSAGLLAVSLIVEPAGFPAFDPTLTATVLWLGVPGTALGYGVWFHLLARTPASHLSAYVFLVPLVALAASSVIFAERLDLGQVVGVSLVVLAVYLVGRSRLVVGTAARDHPEEGP